MYGIACKKSLSPFRYILLDVFEKFFSDSLGWFAFLVIKTVSGQPTISVMFFTPFAHGIHLLLAVLNRSLVSVFIK